MQKLLKQLNKQFDSQLNRQRSYQKILDRMHTVIKDHGMKWQDEDEFACFRNEIMYYSLLNKQLFEDTFRDVYASMFDYWQDLDYQERKHHVNVDVARAMINMKQFIVHDEVICLPIFDERMNRIYKQEMVLFDLKQYGRFKTSFTDVLVDVDYYGEALFQSDFCSCRYIASYERGLAVYSELVNRLYFVEQGKCVDTLSLDLDCRAQMSDEVLQSLVYLFANQDELALVSFIIDHQLVSSKILKKLEKKRKKLSK